MLKPIFGAALGALLVLPAGALAQQNVIPGTDVALGFLSSPTQVGRQGGFPNGISAVALSTTSCNFGSVNVPWLPAGSGDMTSKEDHPFIAFMMTREDSSGRMIQISNRSTVKHGFFALSNSQCIPCQNPSNGTFLGVGCSDTYGVQNNRDQFWLGPQEEINPWLGTWKATNSYFDQGLNPFPPFDSDGFRSLNQTQVNTLNGVAMRMVVSDQEFEDDPSAKFYYASQYVVLGEPEANRENNLGSRSVNPNWTGNSYSFQSTAGRVEGSVLKQWTGSTLESSTNGTADGRVYVAVKVTGPVDGIYRYEYAVHNRDNMRGVSEFRLPVCESAGLSNYSVHDVDDDAGNDWTASVAGGELVFSGGSNAIRWNTIYNFGFDSTAAPATSAVDLVQADAGPGAASFSVATAAPLAQFSELIGPGCSISGTPATLTADGPALLGDASFSLTTVGDSANALVLLYGSAAPATLPLTPECTVFINFSGITWSTGSTNVVGAASLALPVPSDAAFAGVVVQVQAVIAPGPGLGAPIDDLFELSNGLRLRIGDVVPGCF